MAPTRIQVVFSALLFSAMAWGLQCPNSCLCSEQEERVIADCGGSAGKPSSITSIPKGFPADVSSIFLAHHNINMLTKSSFQGLHRLSVLYLYNNQIESIDPETFTDLRSLKVLDLTYNQLRTLKAEHLEPLEGSLQELHLGNNPWHCTCDLLPFQRWLQKMEDRVADSMYITCATPEAMDGRSLLELTPEDMGCSGAPTEE